MAGMRLQRVEQRRPDLRFPFPENFVARTENQTIVRLGRRAKYLIAELHGGEALIMHLGMSGRFTIELPDHITLQPGRFAHQAGHPKPNASPLNAAPHDFAPHDHVVFHLENGARVTYNDARRFGFMDLVPQMALQTCRHFAAMGIEPLGNHMNANYIAARAHNRATDLKAFLLDQRHIAGLGNIYVCEALFRARLSPRRLAASLSTANGRPTSRAERLVPVIRAVLDEAIAAGGSTLRDYRAADGALGYFQHAFAVYGRAGEPCPTAGCRGMVQRIVQAGRSTFFCGRCQK